MPSRTLTFLIVAGWLASAGWFVARDVWPQFRSGEPPPFTIELADEALRQLVPTRWAVLHNGQMVGTVRTTLIYDEPSDSFAMDGESKQLDLFQIGPIQIEVHDYKSNYRVTRNGELRGIYTEGKLALCEAGPRDVLHPRKQLLTLTAKMSAEVRNGRIERSCKVDLPDGTELNPPLEPLEKIKGSILNPMHPVNRIGGLRPGQHWRMPLVDPLADAARAGLNATLARILGYAVTLPLPDASAPRVLDAEVLREPQTLDWDSVRHTCLIIEFRGDEFTARTWVRRSDGLVLKQEARGPGDEWVMQRE